MGDNSESLKGKMNLSQIINTVKFLKPLQILYQIKNRLVQPKYMAEYVSVVRPINVNDGIFKYESAYDNVFRFLNVSDTFHSWNITSNGMLWAYNLNYMDYLLQENMSFECGSMWIDKFIEDLPSNKIGLDPYPIALRGINWIKFICRHRDLLTEEKMKYWNDSLYSQYKLLEKKLEYHLLGNHLLEDAYSLFIASIYFENEKMYKRSSKLLIKELNEQILQDGAHYEQSPMYHCILLERLLDCCNFSFNNKLFNDQNELNIKLKEKAELMLGHLEMIVNDDMSIPLLNDSAYGIAPTVQDILKYANRLNLEWHKISMKECGYRRLQNDRMNCVLDVGNIMAIYQPGHSHADSFNYELRIDGMPFIVDTGISTYNKTERRQYERCTSAHNTVVVENRDSSEVWGGFRVAKRANVEILKENNDYVYAVHNGYGHKYIHYRSFNLKEGKFEVIDEISTKTDAVNYIHLSPNVVIESVKNNEIITNIAKIHICGMDSVEIVDEMISTEYNRFQNIKVVKMYFKDKMKYIIQMR